MFGWVPAGAGVWFPGHFYGGAGVGWAVDGREWRVEGEGRSGCWWGGGCGVWGGGTRMWAGPARLGRGGGSGLVGPVGSVAGLCGEGGWGGVSVTIRAGLVGVVVGGGLGMLGLWGAEGGGWRGSWGAGWRSGWGSFGRACCGWRIGAVGARGLGADLGSALLKDWPGVQRFGLGV